MFLVDTSVWIEHLRKANSRLVSLLHETNVLMHPFVIGELACGNLRNRDELLRLLADLPAAKVATDLEVLNLIERHQLMGRGIGFVDAHLLASVMLSSPAKLWTLDRRLSSVAEELGLD